MAKELPAPPYAATHPHGTEIARVWVLHEVQHVTLSAEIWEEPGKIGLMLVELARHAAMAYGELYGFHEEDSLAQIRESFDAEWNSPRE